MADEPKNIIAVEGGRSKTKGDVPEALRRRYYVDERGGPGFGFYVDARVTTAAFRDQGARLTALRPEPNAIRDMIAIAGHRGWAVVMVRGEADFRREAWLVAMAAGIEARGYRPTERDRQELERRRAAVTRRAAQREVSSRPTDRDAGDPASARLNLRIVETVVRTRIAEAPAQERILAAARERLTHWLERGARVRPVSTVQIPDSERYHGRERQRGR
jgi:hypothetical protein